MNNIKSLIDEYNQLGIAQQLDYDRLYLYSIITHSTAIEGSTVSELENQLLFDSGISPDKSIIEQLMNLDLRDAYAKAFDLADRHAEITTDVLCGLSGTVMKNSGSLYDTIAGRFDSAKGDLRLLNVSAGRGGRSYIAWQKIPTRLENYCVWLNEARHRLSDGVVQGYELSFKAHYRLVEIHPWADGNGRMARLVTNMIQREVGLVPSIVKRERRVEYIESLEKSQMAEDMGPFMDFMMRHHEGNIREQIEEYKQSIDAPERDSYRVDADYGSLRVKERVVLEEIRENPEITIAEIVERNGFSRPTVTRALKELKDAGFIERVGSKKTGLWKVR